MDNTNTNEKIGEWLIRTGIMSKLDVEAVLDVQKNGNDSLFGIIAMEPGLIEPEALITFAEIKGL